MKYILPALAAIMLLATPAAAQAECAGVVECAEQRVAQAQYGLGSMYYVGYAFVGDIFEPGQDAQDYSEAAKWFHLAAEQGHAEAQAMLGFMYNLGQGVPQDYAESAKWNRLASEQGDAGVQRLALPPDYAMAAEWSRQVAEQGDAGAQLALGNTYFLGVGVAQDDAAAAKWYRLAAEQGHAVAQAALGYMALLAKPKGMPQDYVQSHKWANLAAAQGVSSAAWVRDAVAEHMTSDQIAEAQRLAREWWQAATEGRR